MSLQTANPLPSRTAANVPAHFHRLVLAGFMGAGKSTVGRQLATHLNWEFIDLDALIESRTGLTVPAIFAVQGEARFRELESQALASALARDNIVLALGGGTPEVHANRLLLEQTPHTAVVHLDAPFSILFDRCVTQSRNSSSARTTHADPAQTRPVLADLAVAEARFHARRPLYQSLALYTVDTSELSTEEAVSAILNQLHIPANQSGNASNRK